MRAWGWVVPALAMLLPAGGRCRSVRQTEADGYTRYELLTPNSHKFRIYYEVTATTPGAMAFYNPIRPGSIASDEQVLDRATRKPLPFEEVDGATAAAAGVEGAKAGDRFIKVSLARPVPVNGGGGRIQINKTYEDQVSYHEDGAAIVFERPLGIKRNAVVLPAGYVLDACNYPSQVIQQADGRLAIAFWNTTPAPAPLKLRGVRAVLSPSPSSVRLDERAHQNRNIGYYLNAPETHAFALTHDYTETKVGSATYVNIVRTGSTVSNPSARDLDTGQTGAVSLTRTALHTMHFAL